MKKKYYIIALCICIIAIFICSKQFYIGNNEQNKASTNHKDSVEKPPKANLDTIMAQLSRQKFDVFIMN